MTDFAHSWNLSRGRFVESLEGLNQEQLNWKLHPAALSIGEMAIHVAGVEIWFVAQCTGLELNEAQARLTKTATEGVVNDNPYPFSPEEITPELVISALNEAKALVEPHITNPSEEFLKKEIKSALGPIITGHGALTRYAFHPAYHHGQVYQIITAPGFPK